ncbi:hypothetical protein [Pseudomonas amygdali]|nr:hypothetical protein [Pseudomonas amygdali]
MKRTLLPLVFAAALPLMAVSSASRAAESALPTSPQTQQAPSPSQLTLQNPITKQMQALSMSDIANAEKMRTFVAPLPYASELYDAYVKVGYAPLHALILSNWDASEAMRELAPNLPKNTLMEEKIQSILKLYQPAQ